MSIDNNFGMQIYLVLDFETKCDRNDSLKQKKGKRKQFDLLRFGIMAYLTYKLFNAKSTFLHINISISNN